MQHRYWFLFSYFLSCIKYKNASPDVNQQLQTFYSCRTLTLHHHMLLTKHKALGYSCYFSLSYENNEAQYESTVGYK